MKKITLFRFKRYQSKTRRPAIPTNDVKPPDQHRDKTRDLPNYSRFLSNSVPGLKECGGQTFKDTISSCVKAGLVVLFFFLNGVSSARAVDRYQSSVYEEEIIECYAKMASLAYSDIPDVKNIHCDNRFFGTSNPGEVKHQPWKYADFQEITHEFDTDPKSNDGQSITDFYIRCDTLKCNSGQSMVREVVFAFRGTALDLDEKLDADATKWRLKEVSDAEGLISVGTNNAHHNPTKMNPFVIFNNQINPNNDLYNVDDTVVFDSLPHGTFDPQQFPPLDRDEPTFNSYQSKMTKMFRLPDGFKQRADSHWMFVQSILQRNILWAGQKHGRKVRIRTTGHSLGGAQASIMGLYITMYLERVRKEKSLPDDTFNVEVFSYTPPRSMPEQMAKLTQALLRHPHWAKAFQMHIFSNDRDPVARAPHVFFKNWQDNVYHPVPENFVAGPHTSLNLLGEEKEHYVAHVKHDSTYDAYLTIGLDAMDIHSPSALDTLGKTRFTSINQEGVAEEEEWRKTFPFPPKSGNSGFWAKTYLDWTVGSDLNNEPFFSGAHGITQFFKGHWSDMGTPSQRYYTTRMMDYRPIDCPDEYSTEAFCRYHHGTSIVTYEDRLGDQNLPRIADWYRAKENLALDGNENVFLIRSASDTSLCLTADFNNAGRVSLQRCAKGAALLHQLVEVNRDGQLTFPHSVNNLNNNQKKKCLKNKGGSVAASSCTGWTASKLLFKTNLDKRGFSTIVSQYSGACLTQDAPVLNAEVSVDTCSNSTTQVNASQAFLIEPAPQKWVKQRFKGVHFAMASKAKSDDSLSCLKVNMQFIIHNQTDLARTSVCNFQEQEGVPTTYSIQHRIHFKQLKQSGRYFVGGTYALPIDGKPTIRHVCILPYENELGSVVIVQMGSCQTNLAAPYKGPVLPILTPNGSMMMFVNPDRANKAFSASQLCWDSPEMTEWKRNVREDPNRGVITLKNCSYNRLLFTPGQPSNVEWHVGKTLTDHKFREAGLTSAHKVGVSIALSAAVGFGTSNTDNNTDSTRDHCQDNNDGNNDGNNDWLGNSVNLGRNSNGVLLTTSKNTTEVNTLGQAVGTLGDASYSVIAIGKTTNINNEFMASIPAGAKCNNKRTIEQTIDYTVTDEFGNEAAGTIEHYTTDNLAYGKPATQSSTFDSVSGAEKAVDGNKSSDYDALSVSSTAESDVDPWWEVDLQTLHEVRNVRLYNYALTGTGNGALPKQQLTSVTVEALSPSREVVDTFGYGGIMGDYVDLPLAADGVKYVRVILPHEGMLQLAEVEVAGWLTDPVVENVALNKPATQSSTVAGAVASKAVDGNTYGNSITHTGKDNQAWWSVDLEGSHTVKEIKLFNRLNCCQDRLTNFKVILDRVGDSQLVLQPTVAGVQDVFTFPTSVSDVVRVTVQLNGKNYLSLAEVQVFGWKTQSASVKLQNQQSVLHKGKKASQGNSELACPAGYAITGYTGYGQHLMSSVKFRCHKIGTDGKWGAGTWTGEWGGNNSGGGDTTRYAEMCSQDKYVTKIYTESSKKWIIDTIFECGNISLDSENKNRSYRYNPEYKHVNMTGKPNGSGWSKDDTVSGVCENNNVNQDGKYARVFTKANVGRKWRGNASAHVVNEIKYYCDQVKLQ